MQVMFKREEVRDFLVIDEIPSTRFGSHKIIKLIDITKDIVNRECGTYLKLYLEIGYHELDYLKVITKEYEFIEDSYGDEYFCSIVYMYIPEQKENENYLE